jgi:hypothetical protein
MANASTTQKMGIAARILGQQLKRSRAYGALISGAKTTLSHFGSALHQLWLEVTGFVFLAFAGVGLVFVFREYSAYHAGKGSTGRIAEAAGFGLVFAWFGVSSFWRARRKKSST